MEYFPYVFGLFWGLFWAMFLQLTKPGRWLVVKRTWITVVVGVGANLLIALAILPVDLWWKLVLIFALSSLPIIVRSLINELAETEEEIDAIDEP
jgi:hypothetical protein